MPLGMLEEDAAAEGSLELSMKQLMVVWRSIQRDNARAEI